MNVILSCSHISKKFDQTEVLKDVSFTIGKGEKIGLIGANGSGKSTLLKVINGLLEKNGGIINRSKELKIEYFPQVHLQESNLSRGERAKKVLAPIIASEADFGWPIQRG